MEAKPGLIRSMRRGDLIAVVINGVIGAGIFGLPSKAFALAGTYSLVSFGVCAICVSFIVLSFAQVSSRFSETGGPYLFARESYGWLTGFTVGWLVWLARVTAFSANCALLPEYLGFFFPTVASGIPRALLVTAVMVALTAVNVRGVRATADTANALAIAKLVPLALFVVAGMFFLKGGNFSWSPVPGYHPFSQSVLLLIYAFTGFEMACIPAGEARQPERDLPMALTAGMAIVVATYIMIQVVSIGTLAGLASSSRPLADAAAAFMGNRGALLITGGIIFSLGGNLNVLILSASRLIYAMADRGELPRPLAAVHERFRTPAAAVIFTTAIMLLLTLSGTFVYLVTLSVLSRLIAYFLTCAAVPVLNHRFRTPAGFKLPGGTSIPLAGMAVILWLLSNATLREALAVIAATLAGLAACWLSRRRRGVNSAAEPATF